MKELATMEKEVMGEEVIGVKSLKRPVQWRRSPTRSTSL